MWIPWLVFVVALVLAGVVHSRMRPALRSLGDNLIDRRPRFRRHDLERVRSVLERGLLADHRKVTRLDRWFALLLTLALAALGWGIAFDRSTFWLPILVAAIGGAADLVENHLSGRILAAPHRPVPQAEVTRLAVATSVKFAGYLFAIPVAILVLRLG